jgi:hypothetical protein
MAGVEEVEDMTGMAVMTGIRAMKNDVREGEYHCSNVRKLSIFVYNLLARTSA